MQAEGSLKAKAKGQHLEAQVSIKHFILQHLRLNALLRYFIVS
jgi:hypothetical protein